jgi:hypothetical protein
MPAPTNGNIQNNYLTELPETVSINNTTNTVDVNLSDKNRFSAMYSTGKYTTNFTGSLASGTDSLPLPYTDGRFVVEYPATAQLHDTYVISPNLLNQVSISYARIYIPLGSDTAAGDYPQKAGITGLPPGLASTAMPTVTFAGTNAPIGWGGSTATPTIEAVNTVVMQNNVQWTKGRHFLTFGFQFEALGDNYTNPATGTLASFAFSNNETATYSSTGSILSNTGNSWASYLLGAVDSSTVTQNGVAETGGRYKDYAAYIQDDFKVSSKLTVNLGLRWDVWGPFHEVDNRLSFFNPLLPNPAAGGHLQQGDRRCVRLDLFQQRRSFRAESLQQRARKSPGKHRSCSGILRHVRLQVTVWQGPHVGRRERRGKQSDRQLAGFRNLHLRLWRTIDHHRQRLHLRRNSGYLLSQLQSVLQRTGADRRRLRQRKRSGVHANGLSCQVGIRRPRGIYRGQRSALGAFWSPCPAPGK